MRTKFLKLLDNIFCVKNQKKKNKKEQVVRIRRERERETRGSNFKEAAKDWRGTLRKRWPPVDAQASITKWNGKIRVEKITGSQFGNADSNTNTLKLKMHNHNAGVKCKKYIYK